MTIHRFILNYLGVALGAYGIFMAGYMLVSNLIGG